MNQDWDIKPRSPVCQKCESPFADQQPYYTRLSFGKDGYERLDCCEPCWPQLEASPQCSSWKGVFKAPPPPPEAVLKKETAESLLRKLLQEGAELKQNTIYILVLMLERQRLLVENEVTVREDGKRVLIYEHRKTGEVFPILDPQLQLDQLEHVQQEVSDMLAGEASAAASPDSSPAACEESGKLETPSTKSETSPKSE
jgi:hypothetical protein